MKESDKRFTFEEPKKTIGERIAYAVGVFIAGLACLAVVVLLIVAIIFLIKLI